MGSHSVICHQAEVTCPHLPNPKLVLDLAIPEGCKAELTWDNHARMHCKLFHMSKSTHTLGIYHHIITSIYQNILQNITITEIYGIIMSNTSTLYRDNKHRLTDERYFTSLAKPYERQHIIYLLTEQQVTL